MARMVAFLSGNSAESLFQPTFTSNAASDNLALGQRCRRSAILARTRRLIDRNCDIEHVTMRSIAAECCVAVQTLYNMFGSRARLLELAITDHMAWMTRHSKLLAGYPNPVLAFSDLNCAYITSSPNFMRNTALACAPVTGTFYQAIRKFNNECILVLLESMQIRDLFRDNIDLASLASLLNFISQMTPLDWAGGHCSVRELRYEVATRNVCALSNVVVSPHGDGMNEWLRALRSTN